MGFLQFDTGRVIGLWDSKEPLSNGTSSQKENADQTVKITT